MEYMEDDAEKYAEHAPQVLGQVVSFTRNVDAKLPQQRVGAW
jgi:hypothetical protein